MKLFGVFVKTTGKLLAAFDTERDAWAWLLGQGDRRFPGRATELVEVKAITVTLAP